MRILFINPFGMAFNVTTPQKQPLGGMASSTCYLARALATRGHEVSLVSALPDGTLPVMMGVHHVPVEPLWANSQEFFRKHDADAVITVNYLNVAPHIKRFLPKAVNIGWLHVFPDQPAFAALQSFERSLDGVVCVSATLGNTFRLSIPNIVIPNAIAPSFENLFTSADELLAAKKNRAIYASMPFRGLDVLMQVMNRIKGKLELEVYSSMQTYQEQDQKYPAMIALYDAARRNPRTRYRGGVGQQTLAESFRRAADLAYPSTFIESYCIVAQEAMAAGAKVISNDLGALPETTMGFADLLPVNGGKIALEDHIAGFTALLEKAEADFQRDPQAWAEQRFEQLQVVNRESTWSRRAEQWEALLAPAVAARNRII